MAVKQAVDENVGIESLDPFSALAPEPRGQVVTSLAGSQPERELAVPEAANQPFDAVAVAFESLLTCVDDGPDQLVESYQRVEQPQRTRAE